MRKILFGIFMFFLVSLMAGSVSAVTWSGDPADKNWLHDKPTVIDLLSPTCTGTAACITMGASETITTLGITDNNYRFTTTSGSVSCTSSSTKCEMTITPSSAGFVGFSDVTFWVKDSNGVQTDASLTTKLTTTNNVPQATGQSSVTVNEDESKVIYLTVIDGDTEDMDRLTASSFTIVTTTPTTPAHGSLSTITIDTTTTPKRGKVTYTPATDYVGPDKFSFKVNDLATDSNTLEVSITVNPKNDPPVLGTIGPYKAQEGILLLQSLPQALDVDGDSLTYLLEVISPTTTTFSVASNFKVETGVPKIYNWEPEKSDVGKLKLRLYVSDDGSVNTLSDIEIGNDLYKDFTINVYPKSMCEAGEKDGGKIVYPISIDKPASGDEFGPGDTIPVEVTVENDLTEDSIDVVVKAVLYDIENNKRIVEVESDDESIDGGEPFTFKLDLPISLTPDEKYDGKYVVYVKAYEDGAEEENCYSDMVEIDLGRESHDVIIQSMTISPANVAPGSKVDVTLNVLNLGKKAEEGIFVKLRNADLSIDLTSDARSLMAFDGGAGSSYLFRFSKVQIPSDAEVKTYELEAFIVSPLTSISRDTYIDSPTFKLSSSQLVVAGPAAETAKSMVSVGSVQESTEGTLTMPVIVTNTEGKTGLTVSISNVDEWAQDVSEKSVSAAKGQSETVYFNLKLNDDVEAGKYTGTITVKSNGNVVDTKAFTLDIDEEMATAGPGVLSALTGSKVLWIVGDIVLIVVAIFFIKLIFTGKKKRKSEIKEVRL